MRRPTAARPNCGKCDLPLRWERLEDGRDERWLAICACGMPWVFFPSRPGYQSENPLAAGLLGATTRAEGLAPWIRVFQMTSGTPGGSPGACVAVARLRRAVFTQDARGRRGS